VLAGAVIADDEVLFLGAGPPRKMSESEKPAAFKRPAAAWATGVVEPVVKPD